jgi:hypothetical protein
MGLLYSNKTKCNGLHGVSSKLKVVQLNTKCLAFYGTAGFINGFTNPSRTLILKLVYPVNTFPPCFKFSREHYVLTKTITHFHLLGKLLEFVFHRTALTKARSKCFPMKMPVGRKSR